MIFCCTPCSLPGLCDLLLYTVFPAWPGLLLLKSSRVTCPIPNLSFVFSPVTLCYTSRSSPFLCVFTCNLLLHIPFPTFPVPAAFTRVTHPVPCLFFVLSPVAFRYTFRSPPFLSAFTCNLVLQTPFPTLPVSAAFTRVTHPGPRLSFVLSPVTLCYKPRSPSFLYAFTCNLVFTNPGPHLSLMLSPATLCDKPRTPIFPLCFHL